MILRIAVFVGVRILVGSLALVLLVSSSAPAHAGDSPGGVGTNAGQADLGDPVDLEAFIDPIFAEHMTEYDIPGAVFVMVKDGEIILSKGYGYADRENEIPANPERTIFDLGSIGKLFTATAVMQVVEQGLVDLHTDVNEYLTEFQVPDTYDEPITMHHLLTHTAGFDERFYALGVVAPGPYETEPLGENLKKHLPPRVRPPGEIFQYSNAGITLAGHIIEAVTGQTFDDYVTENVIVPLGMDRSAYGLPEDLIPDMAIGYTNFPPDSFTPYETWHVHQKPASGVRSTGVDMAAFMLAHLNQGSYNGDRILEAETVEEMHRQQFTAHPEISGMAYGFWEHRAGDRRGLEHGGQWVGFSNLLYLLPDERVGMIVSYNNGDGIYAQSTLVEAILDRYFPIAAFDESANGGEVAAALEGQYRTTRTDHHSFMSLPSILVAQTINVEALPDGSLDVRMSPSLIPDANWIELGPGVYGEQGGSNVLAFDINDNGGADRAFISWPLMMTMERIAWYQSATFNISLLGIFLAVLLSTLAWPVSRLYRRLRGHQFKMQTDFRRARFVGGTISGLIFAFLISLLMFAVIDLQGLAQIPTTFKALLWLPIIAALLTVPLLVFVVQVWRNGEGPLASRIHLSVLALALVGLIPYLYYWGLLGFHY